MNSLINERTQDNLFPREQCNDGTSLSVQGGGLAYSKPRVETLNNWRQYTHVEVGFIENRYGERIEAPDEWKAYADGVGVMSSIFAYVPTEKVIQFIKHCNL